MLTLSPEHLKAICLGLAFGCECLECLLLRRCAVILTTLLHLYKFEIYLRFNTAWNTEFA